MRSTPGANPMKKFRSKIYSFFCKLDNFSEVGKIIFNMETV